MKLKILLIICLSLISTGYAFSYWEWTPETGKWINPKYAPKPTPEEQWKYALSLYQGKDYEKALKEFRKLIKYYSRSSQAPQAQFMIGQCLEKLGKPYEAALAYQKVVENYPRYPKLEEVARREKAIADKLFASKTTGILPRAKEFLTLTRWEKAAKIYGFLLKNFPYWKEADRIKFRMGESFIKAGKYEKAINEFTELTQDYPNSPLVEEAYYQIALTEVKRSEKSPYDAELKEKAERALRDFIYQHPSSPFRKKAEEKLSALREKWAWETYKVAKFYEKNADYLAALLYYQEVKNKFPDTTWGKASESKIKWLKELGYSLPSS